MKAYQLPDLLMGLGVSLLVAALFVPPPVLVGAMFAGSVLYATRRQR